VEFLSRYDLPYVKIASACLTDVPLLESVAALHRPIVLSTGMSTISEIDAAVEVLRHGAQDITLLHCTSDYPAEDAILDLPVIGTLRERFNLPVGYSGHEHGILPSVLAVAVHGACMVERHVTMSRAQRGSDHAASLEPRGLGLLVRDIRRAEQLAMGGTEKRVHDAELVHLARLRAVGSDILVEYWRASRLKGRDP
jgi:N-acetylneuraminate synthase